MRGGAVSSRDTYYTFSFSPFMLTLFKEDIIRLIEIASSSGRCASFQIGGYSLENEIKNPADIDSLVKNDDFKRKEYHSFYFIIQDPEGLKDKPYLILDISPSSCSLYLSDMNDAGLKKIYGEIKNIIEHRNNFRIFRKRFINFIVLFCDLFLIFYMFFLKDLMEKIVNRQIPDTIPMLTLLLINIIYIIPHGKNKFYLFEKKEVNYLFKNRENLFLIGVLLVIGIFIVISAVNLMKI